MKTVYLSGPIAGLDHAAATDWRNEVAEALDAYCIESYSPMRGKDYLKGAGPIEDAARPPAIGGDAGIVARDRYDTTKCDFMLCNLLNAKRVSIGTMVELGWADMARVPVVLVMEKTGNVHEHPFVRNLSAYRVETIDEAVDILTAALAE